ncbi:MAG: response regulator [Ignavibacteriales bacterium]|nr:MAG: response regulator [Ignavibacteriaceae bacterium]MBV6445029.1 Sensor histidine kinase RcsC [Ignavibacteriaceae bacterium]MBZ0197467.1 response regulator [Ignavibacteriaceae bacterium]MCZ2141862.1 response regulator [Ignavibacteriales bacterium]WKZ73869.1 MAG: response regulator [Ignavibacteriaceae bacterium]
MQTTFIPLFNAVNRLFKSNARNEELLNQFCNFVTEEFDFYSAALFKETAGKLVLLGKSDNVKKSLVYGSEHQCAVCKSFNATPSDVLFSSDKNCTLQTTEFLVYDGCLKLKSGVNNTMVLKLTRKSPFSQADIENITTLGSFLLIILTSGKFEEITAHSSLSSILLDVSNDLRTPANSILGFVSLLYDDKLNPVQTEYVKLIKENAQRISGLLNDLTDMSRVEVGSVTTQKSSFDLKALISEIESSVREKIDPASTNLVFHFGDDIPGEIESDHQRLKTAILNILAFLINESPYGNIEVTTEQAHSGILSVKIAHPGFMVPISKIHEAFRLAPVAEGRGKPFSLSPLSLNLAKKYIESLKGELDIKKEEPAGVTISINLLLTDSSSFARQMESMPKPDEKNNRVLVIEDDYATSKLLSNYLNKWGYEPTIVNAGKKALQILENESFLSIITNVSLPDINGLELLKKIRENKLHRHTPVIVCSVEAEQQKAFLMGSVEYFVKPISYKDLVEVLTSYRLRKDANVLCVDDDINTLNLVKEAIQSAGFNPVAENFSYEVPAKIENMDLDLAIVDLDMPVMNGFDLIKEIKSNPKFASLPIVIYTGKENYEEDLAKINGLFNELLDKKSTKIEDLADTISRMVNRTEPIPSGTGPQKEGEVATAEDLGPSILLVEDYKHSQIIVTRLLKKNGFTNVFVVENGAEAVEQAKKAVYDLILMDMQMPVMNGFEATERIRQMPEYKNVPIIALTAFAMKGDREKCLEAGATDYIPKPIDSVEFIDKVKKFTNKTA